jgi:hypothetical protein
MPATCGSSDRNNPIAEGRHVECGCDRRLDRDRIAECSAGDGERERRMITAADRGIMAGPVERVTTYGSAAFLTAGTSKLSSGFGVPGAPASPRTDDGSSPSGASRRRPPLLRAVAAEMADAACRSCARSTRSPQGRSFQRARAARLARRRERRSCAYLTDRDEQGLCGFGTARIASRMLAR